ncbi:PAS domain S-box protein [Lujinxingia vulgaris]|uniref:histidine kinase n=1 Tax=Lujinxingia vulgaris TaxID=2600176 RepID=A0A5C6X7C4_9DELT|nr:PAS domain S-box protein [Lujinxingia vulgaris]TXD37743.1 PAS domain S-box protein [Lujinxingia vulgaris]
MPPHEPNSPMAFDASAPGETFWAYFDATPNPMKVLNAEGRILRANPAFFAFLQRDHRHIVGKTIFELMHPEDMPEAREHLRDLVSSPPPPSDHPTQCSYYARQFITERRYKRTDGQHVWANLYLMVLWNPDRTFRHVLGEMVDITGRKLAEQALGDRRRELRAILETASDAIITCDAHGMMKLFNDAAERIFGLTQDEARGCPVITLIDAPALEARATMRSIADQLSAPPHSERASVRLTTRARRFDGTSFPVDVGVARASIADELTFTIIVRDQTEQHHLKERVRRTERMEAFGQLAGGVAHDFNNVLTIVRSYAQMIQDKTPQGDERTELLSKILAATDRGARLTRQLLVFSPDTSSERSCIKLNEVVAALDALFQSVIEEDIDLNVDLASDLHPIDADLSQMEQIILNLVINARDAMPDGGALTVRTRNIHVGAEDRIGPERLPSGDYVVLEVEDSGEGMRQKLVDRIFEPFFTTKSSGTGLGLSTVYGIVRGHGGIIDVDSAPSRGTRFTAFLPASCPEPSSQWEPDGPPSTTQRTPEDEPLPSLSAYTILVAEDEDDIRASLTRSLRDEGYTVLEARDGRDALNLAQEIEGTIDLLITDIVMPHLSGWELAGRLPKFHPRMRAVFVSGYAGETLQRKRLSGGDVRITKPYDLSYLKTVVARMLTRTPSS